MSKRRIPIVSKMESIQESLRFWQTFSTLGSIIIPAIVGVMIYYFSQTRIDKYQTKLEEAQVTAEKDQHALELLEMVLKSPNQYLVVYDQLLTIRPSNELYKDFKVLMEHKDVKNRALPLLLYHFPKQVYSDVSLDKEFKLNSTLQEFSNYQREICVKALEEVVDSSSVEEHEFAIKSMLIDICAYSPELLDKFESVFRQGKIDRIARLWSKREIGDIHVPYKNLLLKYNLIKEGGD